MSALQKQRASEANRTHGMSRTSEYSAWCRMKQRCTVTTHRDYPSYGGRGIEVCERWLESFENFIADMGLKPCLGVSIDRIDNERGYEPWNCRWATPTQQANNRRSSKVICANGVTRTMAEWARVTGIDEGAIQQRISKLGWSPARAVTTPTREIRRRHVQ